MFTSRIFDTPKTTLAQQLGHWRAQVAKVRAGTGRARALLIGDSTTASAGAGSSGSLNLVAARVKSRTAALAVRLAALGIPTSDNSVVGDNSVQFVQAVAYNSYDPRVTLGANWTCNLALTCGGAMFSYTAGAVNNLTFTPAGVFDSFRVYYITRLTQGTCTANIDGGSSLGTINMVGAAAMTSQLFSCSKGTHTINIVPNNNGVLAVCAIVAWDSTVPAVDLLQAGMVGATATTFTSTSSGNQWDALPASAFYAADLTIVQLTINDASAATALATYRANLQTIITKYKLTGDVLLESGAPSSAVNSAAYVGACREVAQANNIPFLDLSTRWTDYTTSNGLGLMFDTKHPNAAGYQDIAQAEAVLLATV